MPSGAKPTDPAVAIFENPYYEYAIGLFTVEEHEAHKAGAEPPACTKVLAGKVRKDALPPLKKGDEEVRAVEKPDGGRGGLLAVLVNGKQRCQVTFKQCGGCAALPVE